MTDSPNTSFIQSSTQSSSSINPPSNPPSHSSRPGTLANAQPPQSFVLNAHNSHFHITGSFGSGNAHSMPTHPSGSSADNIALKNSEIDEWKMKFASQTLELNNVRQAFADVEDQKNNLENALATKGDEYEELREMWMAETQKLATKERELATVMTHVENLEKQKAEVSVLLRNMEESSSKKDSEIGSYLIERANLIKKVDEQDQQLKTVEIVSQVDDLRKEAIETVGELKKTIAETKRMVEEEKEKERKLEEWNVELETGKRKLEDHVERIRCKYNEAKLWIQKSNDERKKLETMLLLRNEAYDKKREAVKVKDGLIQILKREQVKLKGTSRELEASREGERLRRSRRLPVGIEDSE
ncbi:hypothetical protein GCK72_017392 [Caenorhabditis remanei]|uniref:Uncharacterized protein n=1 Tax=Caenorhabditis remanei TaxID=31234 RepID=A0A6A5G7Y3_CAERE|nr:hypothetical protein GCK72_017392 [Caenorhabditis remanei]KAF1750841.1 hypothetical protein GCK72_017392 [Caenorhabditis remanei]